METAPSVLQLRTYITVFSATLRPSLDTQNNEGKTAKYKHGVIKVLLSLILHIKHMYYWQHIQPCQQCKV